MAPGASLCARVLLAQPRECTMADHSRLGRELELFTTHPLIGAGLPVWLPKGAAVRSAIEEYIKAEEQRAGYQHVYSPPLGKRELYDISGHREHFAEEMFAPIDDDLVLRPSLCPHHALVFASKGRSYRDLPLRVGELGQMFRAERSGVLAGLTRVRCISLNDAHIFCALDDVGAEVRGVLDLVERAYAALGIAKWHYRLSLRGGSEDPKYVGDGGRWSQAEGLLRAALDARAVGYEVLAGEAAFYGPKIDVQVQDSAGRGWTLSTVQLDFHKPERFDLSYADAVGGRSRPVMVHRSVVGSIERLVGLLLEHNDGAFPAWCAPVQVVVLPVSDEQAVAAQSFAAELDGLRVEVVAEGTLAARVRAARLAPYLAVVGAREAASGQVNLRPRGAGQSSESMPVAAAREQLRARCSV
ncbi:MAG: threonine--tRNA ligase [Nocardioidaceae bacterium]